MKKWAWKVITRGPDPYEERHRFGIVEADSLATAVELVKEHEAKHYTTDFAVSFFVELWRG